MSKTTREILVEARAIIAEPRRWSGPKDHEHDQGCYCAATAIWQAADPYGHANATSSVESVPAGDALAKTVGVTPPSAARTEHYGSTGDWNPIYDWNDNTTHDKVLAAFDQAIEAQPV